MVISDRESVVVWEILGLC